MGLRIWLWAGAILDLILLKADGAQQMVGLRVFWVAAKHEPATLLRLLNAPGTKMLNGLGQRIGLHRKRICSVTSD